MSMAKIKKGDKVVVLAGKDKGREGEVVRAMPRDGKVVVGGVNMIARHTKPTQADPEGGIKRREAPIHVSNVAIKDPKTGKPARVGFEVRDGKKVRVLKGSGEVLNG
jgi:large subunit ribosomal protein L24